MALLLKRSLLNSITEYYVAWEFKEASGTFRQEIAKLLKAVVAPLRSRVAMRSGDDHVLLSLSAQACGIWTSTNQRRAIDAFYAVVGRPFISVGIQGPVITRYILGSSLAHVLLALVDGARFAWYRRHETSTPTLVVRLIRESYKSSLQFRVWSVVFRKYQPTFVLLANDHLNTLRAIAHAARSVNIPVGYVQHASVTSAFPSVRCFNIAFLDGRHSEEIYRDRPDSAATVFVRSGAIRNVDLHASRKETSTWSGIVGVALNSHVEADRLDHLLMILADPGVANRIVIRPHPRQEFQLTGRDMDRVSVDASDGIERFISSIDLLICGSTSTVMEAAAAGVPCMYYQLEGDSLRDYYGFVDSGAVAEVRCLDDVRAVIAALPTYVERQRERFVQFDEACNGGSAGMEARVRTAYENFIGPTM